MNLAFITATPQNAKLGSGTFVGNAYLIDQLRSQGHTVDVFTPDKPSGLMGYVVDRFRWNWGLDPSRFDDYDAVVGLDMDGYTIANRIKAPFIAYIHGIIADEAKFERGLVRTSLELMAKAERISVNRASMVIATSNYSCARLAELYEYKRDIQIIPPPINLQGWDAGVAATRQNQQNRVTTHPTILCVGVQYPRKNVATLIRATALLCRQLPDVEVRIASKGPEWHNLRRLAEELGLNQNVKFLGYLSYEDLVSEYLGCDVFCLPSLQEGFGIVFAEAMATSKPIVASRSSSTPELIQHGVQGMLATPLDPEDLARQLAEVLLSPEKALTLGKAGRAKVSEFDAPRIARQFIELLTKL
ncbi:glycosyltransferase family 4 protein [Aetokthonos hydrillicola Thurmond2011]|jgi:glycosyltransferase involved in cell wall biosynthesis|uniref:Glycosyltransferase family 4 protein n=1 Tax=Aetokthonos hydrillicola Thurmond2011 TaxID=2712845 RepID=A0AAP5IGS0_9CYAN|nr:glycosyltransferase family 4 protein [Aetokthonos hydrillicola]MBO3458053.1 glycosyltransferase family 4 protein [Aetokthonos hydrillicola CCALA 1050]MBW4587112.1 glycosyltransferase family 4 protein [Aetokthonos hydrillicola CCALA 1050]MDR9899638.1 glycosyltransferase family 4 protein [Aetokthonos hydrillicola Thurmond2011]